MRMRTLAAEFWTGPVQGFAGYLRQDSIAVRETGGYESMDEETESDGRLHSRCIRKLFSIDTGHCTMLIYGTVIIEDRILSKKV